MTTASTDASIADPTQKPNTTRRTVQFVVGLVLAVVMLAWGLPHFAHTTWADVWHVMSGVPLSTLFALTFLMVAGLWLYTFTFTGSLPGLTHLQAMVTNVCGSSVGNLLPGGGAAGVLVTYKQLRSWGFTRREISTSIIVAGVWNVLARVALPVVGIVAMVLGIGNANPIVVKAAFVGAITAVLVVALFILVLASERFAMLVARSFLWIKRLFTKDKSAVDWTEQRASVTDLRHRTINVVKFGWLDMTVGLIGFFGLYYIMFWFCLNVMGVQLPFGYMFGAYTIGRLLTAVGLTPGGLGVTETGTAAVLVGWGADPSQATAGVVLFNAIYSTLSLRRPAAEASQPDRHSVN